MREILDRLLWGGLAVLVLVAGGWMGWYYFTFDEGNLKVVKGTHEMVYGELHGGMLRPDLGRARGSLSEGAVDELDLLLVRTLLSRWRMQPVAPSAFDRLEGDLARGWWGEGWSGNARQMLEEMDQRWVGARQRARMVSGDEPMHSIESVKGAGMRLVFPEGVKTADLGSVIEIDFATHRSAFGANPPRAVWTTRSHREVASSRVRACLLKSTTRRDKGRLVFKLIMDMSDDPIWLDPETEPLWITFGNGDVDWEPVAVRFRDSPLLPVPRPAIQFVP